MNQTYHSGTIASLDWTKSEHMVIVPDDPTAPPVHALAAAQSGFSETLRPGLRVRFQAVRRGDGTLWAAEIRPAVLETLGAAQ